MVSSLSPEGWGVCKSRCEESSLKKKKNPPKLFPGNQKQVAAVSWSGFPKVSFPPGMVWIWLATAMPPHTGLSAPSATVWGKQGLAHSGGKTGLNEAGTGGKSWGIQGMRREVSEAACALPFSLVGRE